MSQPQFALADAIEQTVFVATGLDTDRDGRPDRIRVRRPGEAGIDVPVVFEHSRYRGRPGPARNHGVDLAALPRANLPGRLDDYVWRAGHRIGLVVVSTDHGYTLRARPGTRLRLNRRGSELQLPVVGGVAALARRPRSG